jgi:hypothetical protein
MDMETVLPRTCQLCGGAGILYYGTEEDYEIEPCDCKKETTNG